MTHENIQEGREQKSITSFATKLLGSTSAAALLAVGLTAPSIAQDADVEEFEEIVVTGIRKSLRESADIKRNSQGVVDGIVAEDIGKFPNANLAESLQRVTGVSISRQNGEGSEVTVRGFGAGFNQVTLNGRSMPTADISYIGGDAGGNSVGGAGRAFDFGNLSSDGVRALQVYKSGRADVASGGLGATINIETRKPIEEAGLRASVNAKASHDTSVDAGNSITPEVSGFISWADDDQKFGISAFGSYSRRDNGSASVNSAAWNVETIETFLNPTGGRVTDSTVVENAPSAGSLVSVPRDSRYFWSDITRERINGQVVLQFNPVEKLRVTTDYTFYVNESREDRASVSNWFNRPFSHVIFDSNPDVATTVFLEELPGVKDLAMLQTLRQQKDQMDSFGVNVEFDALDNLTFTFDGHTSTAKVLPNAPLGYSQIEVGMAMPVVTRHSVDYSGEVPLIALTRDDSINSDGNGVYDVNDISTQVANHDRRMQENKIDQFDFNGKWDINDDYSIKAGVNWRKQENTTLIDQDRQILGNWGANNPGDVEQYAPGALEEFCMSCQFTGVDINDINSFRGDAGVIFQAVTDVYANDFGRPIVSQGSALDTIEEEVLALYAQFDADTEVNGMGVRFSAGLRYEETDVLSTTSTAPISSIDWSGDNDFSVAASSSSSGFSSSSTYKNWLPNVDLAVDLSENFVSRFSYSRTIARAGYGNLFASDTVNRPAGPTATGFVATGSKGNPGLLPLVSDNFDVSFEWYYGADSWVSVGAFRKKVKNFVGIGQTTSTLFDLLDVTSGAPGTLSGNALASLANIGANVSDPNLFAMAWLINSEGSQAAAEAAFNANIDPATGNLEATYYNGLEAAAGNAPLTASGSDPLYQFQVTQPVNNEDATVKGLEIAAQHFFGDSGFGIAASYTLVDGDVAFDNGGSTSVDQFAVTGLSDTANVTLIYEKDRISARAAWNWRDDFLASTNRGGGFRNPVYTEAFATIDASVSYDVNDNITVSLEAINITGENSRDYGRDTTNLWFYRENSPRYFLGARYKF
jgi:TonB-dependent receptor